MAVDKVGEFEHQVASVCGGKVTPRGGLEGFAGGGDGEVDVMGGGGLDGGDFGFVAGGGRLSGMLNWVKKTLERKTHVGFILVIVSPECALTNSLFMNSPVGCVYLRPLGAVSSIWRSDIVGTRFCEAALLNSSNQLSRAWDSIIGIGKKEILSVPLQERPA